MMKRLGLLLCVACLVSPQVAQALTAEDVLKLTPQQIAALSNTDLEYGFSKATDYSENCTLKAGFFGEDDETACGDKHRQLKLFTDEGARRHVDLVYKNFE